jgi:hypothetical protein
MERMAPLARPRARRLGAMKERAEDELGREVERQ